jgi:ATP-dependent Clp protease ATP-binding subunit ClpA
MFERFTQNSRDVVISAQQLARQFGSVMIGTEHLLLAALHTSENSRLALQQFGVTKESVTIAIGEPMLVSDADRQALASIGIDVDEITSRWQDVFDHVPLPHMESESNTPRRSFSPLWPRRMTPQIEAAEAKHRPFTPRAQRCVELSLREALRLKHHCIEPEHILLGILREGSEFACQIISRYEVNFAELTKALEHQLLEHVH